MAIRQQACFYLRHYRCRIPNKIGISSKQELYMYFFFSIGICFTLKQTYTKKILYSFEKPNKLVICFYYLKINYTQKFDDEYFTATSHCAPRSDWISDMEALRNQSRKSLLSAVRHNLPPNIA